MRYLCTVKTPTLSVLIPVYNEARTIATVLAAVRAVPVRKEIIVIDGDSNDGTVEILRDELVRAAEAGDEGNALHVIFQQPRNGRGGALIEGLARATGDIVVFQDGDLELDPACLPTLMQPIRDGKTNVVFGSRFLRGKPAMTFLQYWGNRVLNIATNLLWGTRLTDVETCYQMFTRSATDGMTFRRNDMAFTMELTLKLIAAGHTIIEVPVTYVPRTDLEGKKLYWADGFITLWLIMRTRIGL